MLNFSVTKNGKELDKELYNWNEETRTFSTLENNLVLDFSNIDNCTFETGSYCTFKTGSYCTFKTGHNCVFKTDNACNFSTGYNCTFDTKDNSEILCSNECVLVRRDVFEVIKLEKNKKIKLNGYLKRGYKNIEKYSIILNNKKLYISEDIYNNIKQILKEKDK